MGCDFFYDGNLPDVRLQEKVVNFVKDFFGKIDLEITPDTSHSYSTEFHLPSVGLKYAPRTEQFEEYSFNFFGIIPDCKDEYGISDHGQFIFNRNDNGRLVKIRRLPEAYGIIPHRYYQDDIIIDKPPPLIIGRTPTVEELKKHEALPRKVVPYKFQVVVDDGGYERMGGGLRFALMLIICKLRWWPDLKMGDDYENCEIVDALLGKYEMNKQMMDEKLDLDACYSFFKTEYDKDFPPPSSDVSPDDRLKSNAKWYLDFMNKIKPYMKEKKIHGEEIVADK